MLLALLAILSSVDFSKIKDKDVGKKAQTAVKQTINAIILPCVHIGDGAVVAAGAVVTSDVNEASMEECTVFWE